jgi:hypothetical protein
MNLSDRANEPVGRDVRWNWSGFLPRSYLFSVEKLQRDPSNLRRVATPVGHLFVSPDYSCHVQNTGDSFVGLVGYCIDLGRPGANESDIVSSLLQRACKGGIDAMLAGTDELFGRFVVVCHIDGQWRVFPDACATRTIYFAEDRPAIASHSTMLGGLVEATPRVEVFRHYWCALPGNASPVPGVRVLPASFVLDPVTRTTRRFWPRAQRQERAVVDVIDEVDSLLRKSAEATAARWKPALSLTAGLDSRLTLSLYHDLPDIVAFTYDRDQQDKIDVDVASRLCERLGIEHRRLLPVDRHRGEKAYQLIEAIPDCTFDRNVAPIYLSGFQDSNNQVIHVRSSLAEVGRAFWRYHPGMPTTMHSSNWIQVSLAKSTADLPRRQEATLLLQEEMKRFFATVGYDSVDPHAPQIMGYDVWDLVYMEHRMSTWHAQALSGSDMAFDTSIPFNSRRVLDLLMSVPLADRRNGTLFRRIIARRCPQIADIPVNPRPRRTFSQLAAGAYRQLKRRAGFVRVMEARLRH